MEATTNQQLPEGCTVARERIVVESGPRNRYYAMRWTVRGADGEYLAYGETARSYAVGHALRLLRQRAENAAKLAGLTIPEMPADNPFRSERFAMLNVDTVEWLADPRVSNVTYEQQGLNQAEQLEKAHGSRFAVVAR